MEEKDFQRIEQMIGKAVKSEVGSVKTEMKTMQAQLGSFKEEIKEDFHLQVGILSEDFQHKLQLVAEGHQMLAEKMDRMHGEVTRKIDAVATDLASHRVDTEGHKRGYQVSES
jgi:predicted phage tail protein